jgi:ABC-2 type transport system ATP-binding protein
VRLRFAGEEQLDEARRALAEATREGEGLDLRVPSDGSLTALKTLIDRLDERAVKVDEMSVHTPDLDDVFLALTGNRGPTEKVTNR